MPDRESEPGTSGAPGTSKIDGLARPEGTPHVPLLSLDELSAQIFEVWHGADLDVVGRILRAHLVVEHFITEEIERRNPNLGSLRKARLVFHQKLSLAGEAIPGAVRGGIERVNELRNKFAHRLDYQLTENDIAPLRAALPMSPAELSPIRLVELFCALAAHTIVAGGVLDKKAAEIGAELSAIKARREAFDEFSREFETYEDDD